jgi:hypothetical protein
MVLRDWGSLVLGVFIHSHGWMSQIFIAPPGKRTVCFQTGQRDGVFAITPSECSQINSKNSLGYLRGEQVTLVCLHINHKIREAFCRQVRDGAPNHCKVQRKKSEMSLSWYFIQEIRWPNSLLTWSGKKNRLANFRKGSTGNQEEASGCYAPWYSHLPWSPLIMAA